MKMILVTMMAIALTIGAQAQEEPVDTSLFQPRLLKSFSYTFSANSKLSFSTGYTTSIGDMMTLLTEPMQVDYRSVRTLSGIIGKSNTWRTSGDWKWQLPMQYFTLSLAASHSEGK